MKKKYKIIKAKGIVSSKVEGFTLVELLVVSTIVALLAGIGFVSYSTLTQQSRDAKRKTDLENVRSALEFYRSDNDYYPADLATLVDYLPVTPYDPKAGRNYEYCPSPALAPYTGYVVCASLEGGSGSKTCCGNCGSTCNYKLSPLGEE